LTGVTISTLIKSGENSCSKSICDKNPHIYCGNFMTNFRNINLRNSIMFLITSNFAILMKFQYASSKCQELKLQPLKDSVNYKYTYFSCFTKPWKCHLPLHVQDVACSIKWLLSTGCIQTFC
jgi:hypothetical protein